ncbi:Methyltransferase-like protein [Arachis hypogaea]|nr:Methyltransferase-like protein [Arachis hypogaea]
MEATPNTQQQDDDDIVCLDASFFLNDNYQLTNFTFGSQDIQLFCLQSASTDFDLTGQLVWPGAMLLNDYLSKNVEMLRGCTAIELGSGVGITGILCSRFCHKVVMTDHNEEVLKILNKNIELHSCSDNTSPSSRGLFANKLEWGNSDQINDILQNHPGGFDLVLGADIYILMNIILNLSTRFNISHSYSFPICSFFYFKWHGRKLGTTMAVTPWHFLTEMAGFCGIYFALEGCFCHFKNHKTNVRNTKPSDLISASSPTQGSKEEEVIVLLLLQKGFVLVKRLKSAREGFVFLLPDFLQHNVLPDGSSHKICHQSSVPMLFNTVEQLLWAGEGRRCKFILAYVSRTKIMDSMIIIEASKHQMQMKEVPGTRRIVGNLEGVIYEITLGFFLDLSNQQGVVEDT